MKKLLLINPVNIARVGLTINKSSRFPPLGLGIVAALTPNDWVVKIIDENFTEFTYQEADLVGITAFTASVNRAYEIAKIYRDKNIPVIMGGIHASLQSEEAVTYVDSVVVGEAEDIWNRVIEDFESKNLQKIYISEKIDLIKMPQASHDLFDKRYLFGSIQTARGCPMDCEFCSVPSFNGHTYRQRPIEDVLDELEKIPQKMIFFVDDNIIGYGKSASKRALDLFKGIIERGIKKEWFCQASLNFADDEEILKYAAKSGCRMVFLGLEAENIESLKDANKKLNIKMGVNSYENAFKKINKYGIAVLGAFIYGLDSDTSEILYNRTNYIINSGVDVIQTTFLTPLPGTRLFNTMLKEGRLLHTNFPLDWNYFDMTEAIFKPKLMEPAELSLSMDKCNADVGKAIWKKFFKTLIATRNFKTAMWALSSNINYQNVSKNQKIKSE
ncbi:MAG: radical SAM protein [Bacteroidales bacterium]